MRPKQALALASLALAGCSTTADTAHSAGPVATPVRQAASAASQLATPSAPPPFLQATQSPGTPSGSEQSGTPLVQAPPPAFRPPCLPVTEAPQGALTCAP